MRVLKVSHSAVVGAWRERERQIGKRGIMVRTLCARRWDEGGGPVELEPGTDEDVVGVRTWGSHPALFLYDPRSLWRALGDAWDVIDVHEEPFALATAEVLLLRAVRRLRTPYTLYTAQNIDKRYPPPFRWLERWVLKHASAVIACNSEAGRIAERKGFPGRADVVPLGVDPDRFHPEDPTDPDGRARVGYVGRLEKHKGIEVLLDAVESDNDLRVTVAGAGSLLSRVRARTAQPSLAGRAEVLGKVRQEDLPALLRQFHVLAVPSLTTPRWKEQFGRVAVEAMGCGIPVVASNSGALPDVVGGAGLLVPEGDVAALRDALVRVRAEPGLAAGLRRAGLARARECSWDRIGERYVRIYQRVTRTAVADEGVGDPEVVVVAFGSPELLRSALEPVRDLAVTVVDNSSMADIRELCDEIGVRYVDPGRNGGFAMGVNFALARRQLPGADVLLLNPDAVIDLDGVRLLHRALRADSDLASVAPAQVDGEGRPARVTWPFPSPWRSWVEAAGLGRMGKQDDYVIGSVLLLRAEALDQVGLFDESFFLYAEETDWSRRASRLGWRHLLREDVQAVHIGAGTSTDKKQRDTYFYASQERYMRKHFGAMGWQVSRTGQWVGATVRARVLRGERAIRARERAQVLARGPAGVEGDPRSNVGVP